MTWWGRRGRILNGRSMDGTGRVEGLGQTFGSPIAGWDQWHENDFSTRIWRLKGLSYVIFILLPACQFTLRYCGWIARFAGFQWSIEDMCNHVITTKSMDLHVSVHHKIERLHFQIVFLLKGIVVIQRVCPIVLQLMCLLLILLVTDKQRWAGNFVTESKNDLPDLWDEICITVMIPENFSRSAKGICCVASRLSIYMWATKNIPCSVNFLWRIKPPSRDLYIRLWTP